MVCLGLRDKDGVGAGEVNWGATGGGSLVGLQSWGLCTGCRDVGHGIGPGDRRRAVRKNLDLPAGLSWTGSQLGIQFLRALVERPGVLTTPRADCSG